MIQLAKHHDGQTLTRLDALAQREAVSSNFLVQILNDLKRGGLIISKRGKAGGYLLAREPREINLQQITSAVEPSILTANVSDQGESGSSVQDAWAKISQSLDQSLSEVTLDSLVSESPMFYI